MSGPTFCDPIVVSLSDPSLDEFDVLLGLALAGPLELAEARRRLRLMGGAAQAQLEQVSAELAERERRHPGISED